MIEHLKNILQALRKEVKQNIETINKNRLTIEMLKTDNDPSEDIKPQIETLYDTNKTLLLINDANLKLQNGINQFISSQMKILNSKKNIMKTPVPKKNGKIDFFELTIKGKIPFNEFHPKFNDEEFVQNLLDYYIENEDYEECGRIQKIKSMKQNA